MTASTELNAPDALGSVLSAMKNRRHAYLPLARDVRYTENGQEMEVGDGLWGTMTGYAGDGAPVEALPEFRIVFGNSDAQDQAFFGATLETTTPGMLALRVSLREGRIAEIEAVSVRLEVPGERGGTVTLFQPSLLTHFHAATFERTEPSLLAPVAPAEPPALAAAVERYFDAVEKNDSRLAPIADDCLRWENGVLASRNPAAVPLDPKVPAYRPFSLGLAQQIDSGFFKRISRVRGRRHFAADADRGLVLTVASFDQPGTVKSIDVPGAGTVDYPRGITNEDLENSEGSAQFYVKRYEPNFRVPMTEFTAQLTKIEDGKISRIVSIARGAPFGLRSGWA